MGGNEPTSLRTAGPKPVSAFGSADLLAWARAGLLRFEQQGPVEHAPEIDVLRRQVGVALTGYGEMEWPEIDQLLADRLKQEGSGLCALLQDPEVDLPQLYLFTLCSAIELDRGLVPVLARIQGVTRPGWLQLGTATALLELLFSDSKAPDIERCRLARHRLLYFDGPGPSVLRHVYTSGDYWRALVDGKLLSEFEPLTETGGESFPADLVEDAARLLRRGSGLALQCERQTGRALIAVLARELGRRPVEITHGDWKQRSVRAVARFAGWLPLVDCLDADGALITAAEIGRQAVLLTRVEQQLPEDYLRLTLPPADTGLREQWWQEWIGQSDSLASLVSACLGRGAIERIGRQLLRPADPDLLQQVRRVRTADIGANLRRVALPVDTHVDDRMLVLPGDTRASLERCYKRCLMRDYGKLGMGATIRATASRGVVLLFSGASGTGKTLAASWLSSRLGAPLFKIDLAMVMNKYVGETEKNLSLALNEAAADDVILLFDEADALFGKRSDGSHGGDRFANMLTNFLLSRIETHSGILVLTTNAGNRMDAAFVRRIDIAVEFLPLQLDDRVHLWQSLLGGRGPDGDLCRRIARHCELAPGHVRNIVVNACCWYPDQRPLSLAELWPALEEEYRKAGRSMPSQLMALKPDAPPGNTASSRG